MNPYLRFLFMKGSLKTPYLKKSELSPTKDLVSDFLCVNVRNSICIVFNYPLNGIVWDNICSQSYSVNTNFYGSITSSIGSSLKEKL